MDTSEVLDLSKENIQPLKQGRNPVKLGTALQAQSNAEVHQKLFAEREQFELLIRMYDGNDPLQPYYDYVNWIEQSFPKHGPDSNLQTTLENVLTKFKDEERYKQDIRYAELLIKYIDIQSQPLEIYQIVYDQGLCTMCAPFYKAWAEEFDKVNDIKKANQIFELGIKVKAQPLELLQEAHLQFQLSVGRRILGHREEKEETDEDYNRQALHKLQKRNIYSNRAPTGAPGQVKQQSFGQQNNAVRNNENSAPFKICEGDDDKFSSYGGSQGKKFPKSGILSKENRMKAGPWTQNGGKHLSKYQGTSIPKPTFQVHEDEGADVGNVHNQISMPRALKPRKKDDFTCPLAVFEPPDPTKRPMYCKDKVYAGGREFQLEELRAALYNRRYEQLAELKRQQEQQIKLQEDEEAAAKEMENEILTPQPGCEEDYMKYKETTKCVDEEVMVTLPINPCPNQMAERAAESQPSQSPSHHLQDFEEKAPIDNSSLLHCQSFTVNTKEAMNVVQEMWNSPASATVFSKKPSLARRNPVSPLVLDESGVFKVPLPPSMVVRDETKTPTKSAKTVKSALSFPIYSDEEQELTPAPAQKPSLSFQVYADEEKTHPIPENLGSENDCQEKDIVGLPLPFDRPSQPILQSQFKEQNNPLVSDPTTLKMLAFNSDSDESCDEVFRPSYQKAEEENKNQLSSIPKTVITAPTPVLENMRKFHEANTIPIPEFQDEDKLDDMTCNTKAFDFVLPSSTPLVGHLKSSAGQSVKHCINGSYIADDVKKCGTKQDLSMIFEASKERYSSSSGSSGSRTQGSVANVSIPPVQPELIEKLAQISANQSDLETSFATLNICGPVDPFSTELISRLLTYTGYPKKHHLIGLHKFETDAPVIHTNSTVKLGDTKYSVIGELGKGNYARVLKATRNDQPVALKQQRPAWEWEWYIVQELQSRLPPNMISGFLHMSNCYIYKNTSILESEWAQYGSLLSVINKLKMSGKSYDLLLSVMFSIQLISIVEYLHKCKIIHGDIKPDNFVLFTLPKANLAELCLKLIDFGRSIDMTLLPEGQTFTTVVTTDGFQCNEMKDGRPWTYQTDLYGLAGSIHIVLLYDYMKVIKKDNKWQLSSKIPRYMSPAVWQDIFNALLNVESCDNQPNLCALREPLEQRLLASVTTVNHSINNLTNVLMNK